MTRRPGGDRGNRTPQGSKLRICFYSGSALPNLGGLELVMDGLARRFVGEGHDVTVVAPWPDGSERPDDSVYPYHVHRHAPYPPQMESLRGVMHHLLGVGRPSAFDIVHCHAIYPQAYLAATVRHELGAALVATRHGGDLRTKALAFYGPDAASRTYWGMAQMDALVAVNRTYREEFLQRCSAADRVVEIPHGVDLEAFATPVPRPGDLDVEIRPGKYALFLGRLARQKGVDLLLEALKDVPADGDIQLVIAGSGKEERSLKADVDRLALRDRVRFVGWVGGRLKTYLLQNCLCLVAPSRRNEAFGLTILESSAAGRPVIASNIRSLDERVEHGRTGFLVPPKAPVELAAALRFLLSHLETADEMGRRARKAASRYSLDVVVNQHLRLYERLVTSARA